MKNSGTCPKCGSTEVARKRGSPVLNSWSRISINLRSLDIWITKYICTDCGYIEDWIDNKKDQEKFKARSE